MSSPAAPAKSEAQKSKPSATSTSIGSSNNNKRSNNNPSEPQQTENKRPKQQPPEAPEQTGWRVKLYRLNSEGSWDDCGTGRIHTISQASICVVSETNENSILLRTRVLVADAYQRQGDNIITWCEPTSSDDPNGVDLALSFQDNEGCRMIWNQLTTVATDLSALAEAQATDAILSRLPRPVSLENLQETADKIAVFCVRQREGLAMYVGNSNCAYLRELLGLFPQAEKQHLYAQLATLAACVKSLLLMNDPCILDTVAQDAGLFYDVCGSLEYDPDLREKSNHRYFLQQRARFRTVVPMTDEDLIEAIHRSFRVQYLKDTLLRPTMDESSLSSLQSLQTFCHAEVIKGVTAGPTSLADSYLVNVMHLLATEVYTLQWIEWKMADENRESSPEPTTGETEWNAGVTWKQHLIAQDNSIVARKERRKGCLLFLKELFNMVRVSLQPCEKDDFVAVVGTLVLERGDDGANQTDDKVKTPGTTKIVFPSSVTLLSILATLLLERTDDITTSTALEILTAIAVHDPNVLRQHCLEATTMEKPTTTSKRSVLCLAPCDNVIAVLLILNLTQTDAGILLQINEILRAILDTDADQQQDAVAAQAQRDFLEVFYDNYAHWIVAPFLYHTMRYPIVTIPEPVWKEHDELYDRIVKNFQQSIPDPLMRTAGYSAVRLSFSVEILRFCIRNHLFEMKSFLLKSKVLSNVTSLLRPVRGASGDRCLKLAVLRLVRTLLSLEDEFYNRHIIQNNLFGPVFEAFRANPVGDNLVSSSIMEICEFIQSTNMRSLLHYIVSKHLATTEPGCLSLEDVSTPYVSTLTTLRERHEKNLKEIIERKENENNASKVANPLATPELTGKALDDQRRFMQSDQDDSYFMDDTDDSPEGPALTPTEAVVPLPEPDQSTNEPNEEIDKEIHRTPRMFSLASDEDVQAEGRNVPTDNSLRSPQGDSKPRYTGNDTMGSLGG